MLDSQRLELIVAIIDRARERTDKEVRRTFKQILGELRPVELRQIYETASHKDDHKHKGVARLKAYYRDEHVYAWCAYCQEFHVHGFQASELELAGNRIARGGRIGRWVPHCHNDDAFYTYDISLFTPEEIGHIADSIAAYPGKLSQGGDGQ